MESQAFTPTDYYCAAFERQQDRQVLLSDKSRVIFAVYCSGVAIECLLRAYRLKVSNEFDSRHNLEDLLIASQLTTYFKSEVDKEEIISAVKAASKFWNNNLRYYSEKKLKRHIGHKLAQTKYKDVTKYFRDLCQELFDATDLILQKGQTKWN